MTYQYKNPIENGYTRIYIPRKQWNKLYPHAKLHWSQYNEYYINENSLLVHKFYCIYVGYLNLLLFPCNLLVYGILNYKEVKLDTLKLLNQKKYGSFSSYTIWKSKYTPELEKLINEYRYKCNW